MFRSGRASLWIGMCATIWISNAAPAGAQTAQVSDNHVLALTAGELQSTVVPPGISSACPNGRILISDDLRRPATSGLVTGRDLQAPDGSSIEATFDLPPKSADYGYGTNDHDLVTLGNGDVLYATGAFTKAPLYPKPAWFDTAYRNDFGPGARSNLLVWRSTDCGASFHFASEFDPARALDGSCALPQHRRDASGNVVSATSPPGTQTLPRYDMGGTDGQLVKVDPESNRIYLTFQCVGFLPETNPGGPFKLSDTQRLERTLIAASNDGGASWTPLGLIPFAQWRSGIGQPGPGTLVLGLGTGVVQGHQEPLGSYRFESSAALVPGLSWGWGDAFNKKAKIRDLNAVYANIWASTTVAQFPGGPSVVAVPATVGPAQLSGYRVFYFDPIHSTFSETQSIAPASGSGDDFVLHLVAAASAGGPILLYWSDFDVNKKSATIRGRLIFPSGSSPDFQIAKSGGMARSWNLTKGAKYWYGDYQTASGFTKVVGSNALTQRTESRFYPVWPEPDGTVHFSEVVYSRLNASLGPFSIDKQNLPILPTRAGIPALKQPLTQMKRSPREEDEVENYNEHAADQHR